MRALWLLAAVVVVCSGAASAQASTRANTQFDGTYHLLAPAFPGHLQIDCPAQNGVAATHISDPIPARARNVHVLGGVLLGHPIQGSGALGHIWINNKAFMGGGTVTVTITISFTTTFHSMSYAEHILGKIPNTQCSISGGYIQTGHRTGP